MDKINIKIQARLGELNAAPIIPLAIIRELREFDFYALRTETGH